VLARHARGRTARRQGLFDRYQALALPKLRGIFADWRLARL